MKRNSKSAAQLHAEDTREGLLVACVEALAKAPSVWTDAHPPVVELRVNGTVLRVPNTVEALTEAQRRILKLKTVVRPPGVSTDSIKSSAAVLAKQWRAR